MSVAYMSFETNPPTLHAPDGPLSEASISEIFQLLPTTGIMWRERGRLLVQQNADAPAYDCGEISKEGT